LSTQPQRKKEKREKIIIPLCSFSARREGTRRKERKSILFIGKKTEGEDPLELGDEGVKKGKEGGFGLRNTEGERTREDSRPCGLLGREWSRQKRKKRETFFPLLFVMTLRGGVRKSRTFSRKRGTG